MKLVGYTATHSIDRHQQRQAIETYCQSKNHELIGTVDDFAHALTLPAEGIALVQRDMLPRATVLELAEMLRTANKQVVFVRSDEIVDGSEPHKLV